MQTWSYLEDGEFVSPEVPCFVTFETFVREDQGQLLVRGTTYGPDLEIYQQVCAISRADLIDTPFLIEETVTKIGEDMCHLKNLLRAKELLEVHGFVITGTAKSTELAPLIKI